jgi:single-strand DNA-binding protein
MQKNSVNKVILVGYVGQDPEARYTQSGTAITNLSIATNESWKNQNGEYQDRTEWHRIVIYGKMAETASQYLKRGQQVYVEGRLATNEWTDKNDIKRKTTEVRCDAFTMLGKKGDGSSQYSPASSENQSQSSNRGQNQSPQMDDDDDDLPF